MCQIGTKTTKSLIGACNCIFFHKQAWTGYRTSLQSKKVKEIIENPDFGAKPDPGRNFSWKIFASGNSPLHVESKYKLFKKPDF